MKCLVLAIRFLINTSVHHVVASGDIVSLTCHWTDAVKTQSFRGLIHEFDNTDESSCRC